MDARLESSSSAAPASQTPAIAASGPGAAEGRSAGAAGDGAEAVPEIFPRPSAGAGRAPGENAPAADGTYSTALVSVPRSCAGAPSAPISDTVDETDTGHSSRNSTTAHSA